MGLTRIRAQQISDIDYKQAVRVITLTNITLSGGAPSVVDGVSLLTGDRILVNGQSDAAQNGLYQVQILGTGSNGTWIRTSDANQDGEIQPGMVVMVTQGNEYADTPWKLITNGVIVIGVTELVFEENYSLAFGNVFANGTAVIANTVSATISLEAGNNISITGNNTSKTVSIAVTGISLSSIANGTSNLDIATANGNITGTVDGNTVLILTGTGANIDGYITATGNITGGNIETPGDIAAIGNVTANTFVGNLQGNINGDTATFTGNVTADTVSANINGATGTFSGNVTADTFLGNVDGATANFTGNVTADTFLGNVDGASATFSGNVTADTFIGNIQGNVDAGGANTEIQFNDDDVLAGSPGFTFDKTSNLVTVSGNIAGANLVSSGVIVATGNVTGGNVETAGTVTATGNVTGGNLITNGTVSAATLSTSGNAIIGGNLTVQGNLVYVNVEDLRVVDPIIIMGTGPNGDPLTSDDGQDRGIYMEYYIADLGNAFMGFQNSSGNLIAASNVGFSANNVISVVEYGTLQAGNLYVESVVSVGNITGTNILGNGAALSGIDGFGNIDANGTAILATTVSDTLTITAGNNISITGNNTAKSVTIDVTGISLNSISNGTSNVTVVSSGGNVTVGVAGSEVAEFSTTGLAVTGVITGNGTGLTGINAFGNIAVSGETTVSADNTSDTVTLVEGIGIAISTDAANNSITITGTASGGQSIFNTGGGLGLLDEAIIVSQDLGLISDAVDEQYGLGLFPIEHQLLFPDFLEIDAVANIVIFGGTNGQYLGTSGNGVLQWQNLASADLFGPLAGNITGNGFGVLDLASFSMSASGGVASNFIPTANVTYNLGNTTNRWNELWLAGSTIYLGAAQISAQGGNLLLPSTVQIGNVTLTESGGNLALPENISATAVTVAGNIDATGNITGGNLNIVGDAAIDGNLAVQGSVTGNGIPITTVANTAPVNPEQGDIWINTDDGHQYIYFTAGGNSQWAEMEAYQSFSFNGTVVDFTSIASNVLPSANVTYDLGSSANRWNDLWSANITTSTVTATGNITAGNIETSGEIATDSINSSSNLLLQTNGVTAITIDNNQDVTMSGTGFLQIPAGNTAQRPVAASNGQARYNTEIAAFEFYQAGEWVRYAYVYEVEYLVVAGGGGGGDTRGGGGGGGGMIAATFTVTRSGAYSVTVGAGGSGATTDFVNPGSNGANSSAFTSTAIGGGGGGSRDSTSSNKGDGVSGGSGGGGSGDNGGLGASGTSGQGNSGGNSGSGFTNTGGGGGGGKDAAGSVGTSATSGAGGAGGAGAQWLDGNYYAGGGGGGSLSSGGAGGTGGGGAGASVSGAAGTSGTGNTGGGGGGGSGSGGNGGNGGSGIVIVRYPGAQRGSGGTVTSAGGYTYHTFTTSGTYTA